MSPMPPIEPYWLAAGGAAGAFVRAIFIKHQATLGRETIFDVILGLAVGFLWTVPLFGLWPPFELAERASLPQRAAIVGVVTMIGVEVIKRILLRWAPTVLERLGAKLPGFEPEDKPKQ